MRHTHTQKNRVSAALSILAGCTVVGTASVIMAQSRLPGPGPGFPSCFENTDTPACDFYIDLTPDCPDNPVGGGTCGTRFAVTGLSGVAPANASCVVTMYAPDNDGNCEELGTFVVNVGCSIAAGQACS